MTSGKLLLLRYVNFALEPLALALRRGNHTHNCAAEIILAIASAEQPIIYQLFLVLWMHEAVGGRDGTGKYSLCMYIGCTLICILHSSSYMVSLSRSIIAYLQQFVQKLKFPGCT